MKKLVSIALTAATVIISTVALVFPCSAASEKLTSKQATTAYTDMVDRLVDAVEDENYTAFAKLLDSSYSAKTKKSLYENLVKDMPENAKTDVTVFAKTNTKICGSWYLYSNTTVKGKNKFSFCTPNSSLNCIMKYKSGWKFSCSDKLSKLTDKTYEKQLDAYSLKSVDGYFTCDYELITKKVLIKNSVEIRTISASRNADGTITVKLAFLNGFSTAATNVKFTVNVSDKNGKYVYYANDFYLNRNIPANSIVVETITSNPELAAELMDLSSLSTKASLSYNY